MKKRKRSSSRRRTEVGQKRAPIFVCPSFLLPEERVIFKVNPHWLFVVVPEVALALLGLLILTLLPLSLPPQVPLPGWFPPLFALTWALAMAVVFLDWLFTRYYLTDLRLIEGRGIIGKRTVSIWLDKVQDVTVRFGILGRLFGFGDIEVESAGTYGKITFGSLPSPEKLQEEIEKAILNLGGRVSY